MQYTVIRIAKKLVIIYCIVISIGFLVPIITRNSKIMSINNFFVGMLWLWQSLSDVQHAWAINTKHVLTLFIMMYNSWLGRNHQIFTDLFISTNIKIIYQCIT
jgi:hypothetical protein